MNDSERIHSELRELVVGSRDQGEPSENGFARCYRRVPEIRALLKSEPVVRIRAMPEKQAISIWHQIFLNTDSYELASLSLYYYQHCELSKPEFSKIKQWIRRCDCWEHSDDLSKIYADTLEHQYDWVMPLLQKWNRSRNPWQRRQSVVSLLEYAQKRKKVAPYPELINMITPLMGDPEYYVQKGVGWAMREIYNVYPAEMLEFFHARHPEIMPLAWSAATEKLDKETKAGLNAKRKTARQKLA